MATKQALLAEVTTNFPDNTVGAITPAITRTTHNDEINSWQQAPQINPQIATSYTVSPNDYGQMVTFSNASPVAVSLPAASTTGFTTFNAVFKNIGAGLVTITTVSGTIDGAASVALSTGQSIWLISDGANYRSALTAVGGGGGGTITVGTTPIVSGTNTRVLFDNSGIIGEYTNAQLTALIQPATSSLSGVVPAFPGTTTSYFRGDGSYQILNFAAVGGQASLAQLPTLGANTVLGSIAGGAPAALTTTQLTTLINTFSSSLSGAAPASGGGTANFLRADGSWVAPPTGGTITINSSAVSGGVSGRVLYDNAGTVGELSVTGSGNAVLATSPVLTNPTLGAATATSINKITFTTPATGSTFTLADSKTFTVNNSLTLAGTDGTTMTFPSSNANVAALNLADQVVTGGANVTALSLTAGNVTIDCGNRPLQFIANNGAFTITAPSNDGSCILLVTNGASAGAIAFSGFNVGANTGDALTTTNTQRFSIFIWRINGVSGYRIAAHQ